MSDPSTPAAVMVGAFASIIGLTYRADLEPEERLAQIRADAQRAIDEYASQKAAENG